MTTSTACLSKAARTALDTAFGSRGGFAGARFRAGLFGVVAFFLVVTMQIVVRLVEAMGGDVPRHGSRNQVVDRLAGAHPLAYRGGRNVTRVRVYEKDPGAVGKRARRRARPGVQIRRTGQGCVDGDAGPRDHHEMRGIEDRWECVPGG